MNSSSANKQFWNDVLHGYIQNEKLVIEYITGRVTIDSISPDADLCAKLLANALLLTDTGNMVSLLRNEVYFPPVTPANVPQFSRLLDAAIAVPRILADHQKPMSYVELGYALSRTVNNNVSAQKYGENHGKLAALWGLANLYKEDSRFVFSVSPLGMYSSNAEPDEKMQLLKRLCFRIPMVQIAAVSDEPIALIEKVLKETLAESTFKRRLNGMIEIFNFAMEV